MYVLHDTVCCAVLCYSLWCGVVWCSVLLCYTLWCGVLRANATVCVCVCVCVCLCVVACTTNAAVLADHTHVAAHSHQAARDTGLKTGRVVLVPRHLDLADETAVTRAFTGLDVVVHLAANIFETSPWPTIVRPR